VTTAPAIDVRPADRTDAVVMAAIHAVCFAKNWDADAIGQFIGAPACLSLIASAASDCRAQGFLIARSAGDEAELLTLAVDPALRRHGLARALLDAAIVTLRVCGAKQLFLEVDQNNAAARSLYQSLGAVVVGRRKRYYEHGAHAEIFSLAL
jgi:ribosomal-protein-alanine N-acetyltransferase